MYLIFKKFININISTTTRGNMQARIILSLTISSLLVGSIYTLSSDIVVYAAKKDRVYSAQHCEFADTNGNNKVDASQCCASYIDAKTGESGEICQTCFLSEADGSARECWSSDTPGRGAQPGGPVTGPLGGAVSPMSPNILPFDLRDILNLPENVTFSIGVEHGPNSDTIRIEIPKTLSSSILNQTATGFEIPKALSGLILNQSNVNQTTTGLGFIPQSPMVPSR